MYLAVAQSEIIFYVIVSMQYGDLETRGDNVHLSLEVVISSKFHE